MVKGQKSFYLYSLMYTSVEENLVVGVIKKEKRELRSLILKLRKRRPTEIYKNACTYISEDIHVVIL